MGDKKEKEERKKRKEQRRSERGRKEEYEKKIVFWMCLYVFLGDGDLVFCVVRGKIREKK